MGHRRLNDFRYGANGCRIGLWGLLEKPSDLQPGSFNYAYRLWHQLQTESPTSERLAEGPGWMNEGFWYVMLQAKTISRVPRAQARVPSVFLAFSSLKNAENTTGPEEKTDTAILGARSPGPGLRLRPAGVALAKRGKNCEGSFFNLSGALRVSALRGLGD